jgi:hypothetical protein
MNEDYPLFTEQGDYVQAAVHDILRGAETLTSDEIDSIVELVAASYQKALQLRYSIEGLMALTGNERDGIAESLERIDDLLGTLATWHATTRDKLYYTAQRLRAAR